MEMTQIKPRKKPGRPLSFDREQALESAMLVFWRYGYEATSLNDLTSAMGITPPSLYTAFGDKERLFLEAVKYYLQKKPCFFASIAAEALTAKESIRSYLEVIAISQSDPNQPLGCMVVTSATNCTAASSHVQEVLADYRMQMESGIKVRLDRGISEGDLGADTDTAALASFFVTVIHGMSTQARDNASREKLLAIGAQAMRAWPDPA
ncbi:TetR/AcrR family transcriptional regulator [Collimonas sp. PA-H2]|uniref:TetR/AcrR family transcriptional regulator n=1 Tax=Collimonas sp. PA-H2 TaxID=1881062 RepID=UPI000BF75D69|nr:TetR/AcrR family transcriptional regulator [Collimonas sp. PA-H2]